MAIIDHLNQGDAVYIRVYKVSNDGIPKLIGAESRQKDIGMDSINMEILLHHCLRSTGGKYLIEHAKRTGVIRSDILYPDGSALHIEREATFSELKRRKA